MGKGLSGGWVGEGGLGVKEGLGGAFEMKSRVPFALGIRAIWVCPLDLSFH